MPREHIESRLPPTGARGIERDNVLRQLAEARIHRNRLSNTLAIERQDKIIQQLEARLREFEYTEWLTPWLT